MRTRTRPDATKQRPKILASRPLLPRGLNMVVTSCRLSTVFIGLSHRFHSVATCHRQTDRQTDGRTGAVSDDIEQKAALCTEVHRPTELFHMNYRPTIA